MVGVVDVDGFNTLLPDMKMIRRGEFGIAFV